MLGRKARQLPVQALKARPSGLGEKSEVPVVVLRRRTAEPVRSEGEPLVLRRVEVVRDREMTGMTCKTSGLGQQLPQKFRNCNGRYIGKLRRSRNTRSIAFMEIR